MKYCNQTLMLAFNEMLAVNPLRDPSHAGVDFTPENFVDLVNSKEPSIPIEIIQEFYTKTCLFLNELDCRPLPEEEELDEDEELDGVEDKELDGVEEQDDDWPSWKVRRKKIPVNPDKTPTSAEILKISHHIIDISNQAVELHRLTVDMEINYIAAIIQVLQGINK